MLIIANLYKLSIMFFNYNTSGVFISPKICLGLTVFNNREKLERGHDDPKSVTAKCCRTMAL